jgi:phosphatidylserine/phosphatidylglycerophosphate/cardiolipin synthase-like enzyme
MGVEIYEMRSDPDTAAGLLGSSPAHKNDDKRSSWLGSGVGGSKGGTSRASLHTKAVIIDNRFAVIGSMNLDLRSQLKNTEVGLVIRSPAIAQQATAQVDNTLATAAYKLEKSDGHLVWRAPKGAAFPSEDSEPGAPTKLKLLVRVLGPFAPDEML